VCLTTHFDDINTHQAFVKYNLTTFFSVFVKTKFNNGGHNFHLELYKKKLYMSHLLIEV